MGTKLDWLLLFLCSSVLIRAPKPFGSPMAKSHSSKQWLRRHVSDPFVQRSKREGYRSRSAYKLTGIDERDQARTVALAEIARDFALLHLKQEGALLVKIFQGAGYDDYLKSLRRAFEKVVVRKPEASRGESAEQYLLGRGVVAKRREI